MADVEEKKSKKKAPKEVANEDDAPEATEVKEEKAERKKKETDGTDSPRDGAKAPKLKLKSPRSEGATSQPTSPRAPTTPRGTPLDDEKDSTNLATFPVPKLFLRGVYRYLVLHCYSVCLRNVRQKSVNRCLSSTDSPLFLPPV
jgi:hypothetical protein